MDNVGMISPMLCMEIEVNGALREHGLDATAVTAAYRKAILQELKNLRTRGFVAERKGVWIPPHRHLAILPPKEVSVLAWVPVYGDG